MIDFSSDTVTQNLLPTYKKMRHETPVYPLKSRFGGDALMVTRYEDVLTVLKDDRFTTDRRRVGEDMGWLDAWWSPRVLKAFLESMIMVDEPEHTRLKNLVHQAFTPRRVHDMADRLHTLCHELLDKTTPHETFDLVEAYSLPVPMTIISEMMGVPEADRHNFRRWTAEFLAAQQGDWRDKIKQVWNGFSMYRFFKRLINERRDNPTDDLTSALVNAEHDGEQLNETELIAMLFLLLLAGHETTVHLISTGTLALLEHPQQLARLKASPDLMDSTVEELLRYAGPVRRPAPRYVLEDVELSGVFIPAGSVVYPAIMSANRDETVFENPDTLDITRQPNRHLALGFGIHYCLGAPLARLEAKIAFQVLLERCPNLELAVPAERLPWSPSLSVRGVTHLPVRYRD